MADLGVNIAGVHFKNPVITASGTFGFGQEYARLYDISRLGGISCKGTTLKERPGNPVPRVCETPSGILNCVGLQNPGVDAFIKDDLPFLEKSGTVIIANIAGSAEEDYVETVSRLNGTSVDMIELNISCPNVKEGGMAFGVTCAGAAAVVKAVRRAYHKTLIVKLSPNVTDVAEIARACEAEGADSVSLINTLMGMTIDIERRKPVLSIATGGLSGPAVKPVALRMVWQVAKAVSIPVIGLGGISTAKDAIEFFMAGATAIQIGTANFVDPMATIHVRDGVNRWLDDHGCASVTEIIGALNV